MLKKNKGKLILSSILILLPMFFGLIVWDKLPQSMPIHWGVDGKADGFSSPLMAVLVLPLILLAVHWLCLWLTRNDNRENDQSKKIVGMVYWLVPMISLFAGFVMYAAALDYTIHMGAYLALMMGIMFIFIGNYMPKCRQNRTIGIRIKWTLANEENWERTHRLAGKVWVIMGVLCLPMAFLPATVMLFAMFTLVTAGMIIPITYSYKLYKKHLQDGTATKEDYKVPLTKQEKIVLWTVMPLAIALLVFCVVICFTGDIGVNLGEDSFTIEASYYDDLRLPYEDIDSVEYRTADNHGERVNGFGTPRLLMGWFRNEEFGNYTRYSYTETEACVVITSEGKTLVIGLRDEAETKAFYDFLMEKVGG